MRLLKNLSPYFLLIFIVSGCSYYSRQEISYLVSGQLIKLRMGMKKSEVVRQLGGPNEIHSYPGGKYPDKSSIERLRSDMIFCPQNLPDVIQDRSEVYIYTYNVNPVDKEGYYIFLNRKGRVSGWAVGKNVLPENWGDIVASKSSHEIEIDPSFAPGSLSPLPPEAVGLKPPADTKAYTQTYPELQNSVDDDTSKSERHKKYVKKASAKNSVKNSATSKKSNKKLKKKKSNSSIKKKSNNNKTGSKQHR